MSEALYGSELSCTIYFPSKKAQQQLWLQYQKGEQGEGEAAWNAGVLSVINLDPGIQVSGLSIVLIG